MQPLTRRAVGGLVGFLALTSVFRPALAQTDSTTSTLPSRLDELDQRIRVLTRLRELEADSAREAARARAVLGVGPDGFVVESADRNWRLQVTGYFQADQRFYLHDMNGLATDNLIIRRARPIVQGTVYRYFDFRIMPDFGEGRPTLYEAYLEARIRPELAIRAGKYKPPVGLERLMSATDLRFIERGFPTNLAPNRDVGIQVSGDLRSGILSYAVGVFDGVPDLGFGDVDGSDSKDLIGRLFLQPFALRGPLAPVTLGLGVSASTGNELGTVANPVTSNLRTPGQQLFFRYRNTGVKDGTVIADGRRTRIAPQAYLYRGNWGLLTEYTVSRHHVRRDTVAGIFSHRGWQVSTSIVLTGERNSYRSVTPRRPFDPVAKTWGALELAARYQETSVPEVVFPIFADPVTSPRRARAWGIGLNWHLARNVKFMLDFERAVFYGGAASGNRPAEQFLVTRFQTAF